MMANNKLARLREKIAKALLVHVTNRWLFLRNSRNGPNLKRILVIYVASPMKVMYRSRVNSVSAGGFCVIV